MVSRNGKYYKAKNVFRKVGEPSVDADSRFTKWWIHLEHIDCPISCKLPVVTPLIPKSYFTTTGDVMAKLDRMEKDAWLLAGSIRALKNLAKKSLGDSKWLESCNENPEKLIDGKVWCMPKSPKDRTATNYDDPNRKSTTLESD